MKINPYLKNINYINILKIKDILTLIVVFLIIMDIITTVYGLSIFKGGLYEKNIIINHFINIFGLVGGVTLSFLFKILILVFMYYIDNIFYLFNFNKYINNFYVNVYASSAIFISMMTTLYAVINNFMWIL